MTEICVALQRLPHGEGLPLPEYMTEHAAGADLRAAVGEQLTLLPGARALVPTGFSIALPPGYEAQIRPRSGLAIRSGVTCLNSPGTIDADYRGELAVVLANFGTEPVVIRARRPHRADRGRAGLARARSMLVDELPPTRARRWRIRLDGRFGVNVYIVGKGAVGTYFGDLLRGVGVDVSYAPRALDDVTPYDADVALVATKSYDTDGAIETLRKAIAYPEKCVFVSPQNGVGNEERLAAAFGADNVVAAALTTPVDRDRDGNARPAKRRRPGARARSDRTPTTGWRRRSRARGSRSRSSRTGAR